MYLKPVSLIALSVLLVLSGMARLTRTADAAYCDSSIVSVRVTVWATEMWQETYVPISDITSIEYDGGRWTVNRRNINSIDPYVTAAGYNRRAPIDNAIPGARNGGLIGRGSFSRDPFFIGERYSGTPNGSGTLQLAINDVLDPGGVGDNDGAVYVLVFYCQSPLGSATIPPDGTFVQVEGRPAIYIIENGQKRAFPTWETYLAWGGTQDRSNVWVISSSQLDAIPRGPDVPQSR
jgi:hypothetical protein